MKNLDLNKYGVQEMNAGEMRENNGGVLRAVLKFLAVALASELLFDGPEQCFADFKEGYRTGF